MSENVFRAQLSSWRNSASVISHSAAAETESFFSKVKGFNPFARTGLRLPLTERAEDEPLEEPSWFTLSRWDRLLVFGACLLGAVALFALCFALLPVLAVKPRKFATIWSLASLLFIISFGVLQGPVNYLIHLVSPGRILFTIAYFGSIVLTLVFSMGLRSTILTLLAIIVQMIAAIWYTVSYFPMGTQSLKFASRVGARQVTSWINS
ncbi:Protein transport protein SFT2 [Wickerhamiella sorbophila]|uniref:Protein transport protein SFT2 n=1 Tax=Wickerhamiella sorbophila TaxID=45607 RepID=A0A2T0FHD0_9ASCO|nr:Protein transport protein SFT2 [Wickerhamiella sorbophila]PRT54394.1 Protein transport protein SFT2 [Wickerhamiella sorbophila]